MLRPDDLSGVYLGKEQAGQWTERLDGWIFGDSYSMGVFAGWEKDHEPRAKVLSEWGKWLGCRADKDDDVEEEWGFPRKLEEE